MTIRRLVIVIFIVMSLLSVAFATLVYRMHNNEIALLQSFEKRYHSYLLADELRQSSDDLTRFARSYAVTGEQRFQDYYQQVLAIRNGQQPRPDNYQRIYWDFLLAGQSAPRASGEAVALHQLMVEAGFTEQELAKLELAEANSNALVATEILSSNARQGRFSDATGEYSVRGPQDPLLAQQVLFDRAYHQEKAKIMRPVDDFFSLVDSRTQAEVDHFLAIDDWLYKVLIGLTTVLVLLAAAIAFALYKLVLVPLGGEPEQMNKVAKSLARGDMDIDFGDARPKGVYGALKSLTLELESNQREINQRQWLQQGIVSVSEVLQRNQELDTLSHSLLALLCDYMPAQGATIFCYQEQDGQGVLLPQGSYAQLEERQGSRCYKLGEGLVGQVALEGEIKLINKLPDGYMAIQSGLGECQPRQLVLIPFCYMGQVRGVLELALLEPLSEVAEQMLETIRESLALTFESILAKQQLKETLAETQVLSEELQTQQEELRVTNESLYTKAQELEQASRYKTEFLANMSHELRTPLNSLLILSQLLADNSDGNLSEDEVQSAQVINEGGTHLLNLINDILDLSKVEAGKLVVEPRPFSLVQMLQQLENRFMPICRDKSISYLQNLDSELPEGIVSDPMRLEQILTNLIGNAIKFTAEGGVTLSVNRIYKDQQPLIQFAVKDTGIGIDEQQHEAIFQAFQQEDGSTTREFGGTGLGLSISAQLARLLEGEIELQSIKGQGSIFTLTIQLQAAPELAVAQFESKTTEKAITATKVVNDDRNTINPELPLYLIVEDDNRFANILYQSCHRQGAQALIAENGEQGVELCKQYAIDGIILDYMLPGMDGGDVLENLKADPTTADIPVHVISALDDLADLSTQGVRGQWRKPISRQQIDSLLEQLEGQSKQVSVLVVEDDIASSLALQKLLRIDRLQVDFVHTGAAALEALLEKDYAAMILDLGLPDISGIELLESIAQRHASVPPVIVHTGRDLSDEQYLALNQHTSNIIIKSSGAPQRLLGEVQKCLGETVTPLAVEPSATSEQLVGVRVLLVDDDMRNTFALAKQLRAKQLEVSVAPSGEKALSILESDAAFDLVLLDIMMPGMDGYQTLERLRKLPECLELPVVFLTANAMPGDREKSLQAGAVEHLYKPIDMPQLLLTIEGLVRCRAA